MEVVGEEDSEHAWLDSFVFQQRHGRLNVRQLSRLSLDQVVERVDVAALQELLENIAFCDLRPRDLSSLSDATVAKAFRVAQLLLEYLLNLENALYARVEALREKVSELEHQVNVFKQDNRVIADENDSLRKELRQKKRALATFEYVLATHGPGGLGARQILEKEKDFMLQAAVCSTCGKAFSTKEFLRRHCRRRGHPFYSPQEEDDRENQSPNVDLTDQVVAKLQKALAEQEKDKTAEVEKVRQAERRLYEEQLSIMKEQTRLHEQRVEAHYKAQLLEQQALYEKRITALQTKLTVLEEVQSSITSASLTSKTQLAMQESVRLERLERELATYQQSLASVERGQAGSNKDEEKWESVNREIAEKGTRMRQEMEAQNERYKRTVLHNMLRVVRSSVSNHNILLTTHAFSQWKLFVVHAKGEQRAASLDAKAASMKLQLQTQSSQPDARESQIPPRKTVEEHVALFRTQGEKDSHAPLSDERVRQIAIKYVHLQKSGGLSERETVGMDKVDALLDTQTSLLQAQLNVGKQPLDCLPLPDKPYIRARWEHRPAEIQMQLESIEQQLADRMASYDPSLPGKQGLTDEHFGRLMTLVDRSRDVHMNEKELRALKAVTELSDDLTQEYFQPPPYVDILAFEDDIPKDELLQQALVPIKQRQRLSVQTAVSSVHPPEVHTPRSSVYSDPVSDHEFEEEGEDEFEDHHHEPEENVQQRLLVPHINVIQGHEPDASQLPLESSTSVDNSPLPPPPPAHVDRLVHHESTAEKQTLASPSFLNTAIDPPILPPAKPLEQQQREQQSKDEPARLPVIQPQSAASVVAPEDEKPRQLAPESTVPFKESFEKPKTPPTPPKPSRQTSTPPEVGDLHQSAPSLQQPHLSQQPITPPNPTLPQSVPPPATPPDDENRDNLKDQLIERPHDEETEDVEGNGNQGEGEKVYSSPVDGKENQGEGEKVYSSPVDGKENQGEGEKVHSSAVVPPMEAVDEKQDQEEYEEMQEDRYDARVGRETSGLVPQGAVRPVSLSQFLSMDWDDHENVQNEED